MWYLTHFISKILSESDNIYIVSRINKNMYITVRNFVLFIKFSDKFWFFGISWFARFSLSDGFEIFTARMRNFLYFFRDRHLSDISAIFILGIGIFVLDRTSRQKPILIPNWSYNDGEGKFCFNKMLLQSDEYINFTVIILFEVVQYPTNFQPKTSCQII